jgi:hypothetical protein
MSVGVSRERPPTNTQHITTHKHASCTHNTTQACAHHLHPLPSTRVLSLAEVIRPKRRVAPNIFRRLLNIASSCAIAAQASNRRSLLPPNTVFCHFLQSCFHISQSVGREVVEVTASPVHIRHCVFFLMPFAPRSPRQSGLLWKRSPPTECQIGACLVTVVNLW